MYISCPVTVVQALQPCLVWDQMAVCKLSQNILYYLISSALLLLGNMANGKTACQMELNDSQNQRFYVFSFMDGDDDDGPIHDLTLLIVA